MSLLRTNLKLAVVLAVASLGLGAVSPAFGEEEETLVPPGNSAVNQYTESYPTTRGNKTIRAPKGSGGQQKERSPKEVLGSRNAERLEQQGNDGEAVAELATETAPASASGGEGGQGGSAQQGGSPGAGSGGAQGNGQSPGSGTASTDPASSDSDGSSAFGEVVGQATGSSSSDGLGVVLPLLILAAVVWALLYAWRHRRHQVS